MNLPVEIWVVFGSTGEYSDRSEWMVAGYTTKEAAEQHRDACRKWYDDNGGVELRHTYWRDNAQKNPLDPDMSVDYTGTAWDVFPLTLYDAVPKSLAQRAVPR